MITARIDTGHGRCRRQSAGTWLDGAMRPIGGESPFGLMGILNVTPDSFYDGGQFNNVAAALERCGQLMSAGAAVVDIGAESTRPGARALQTGEEAERLLPVVSAIRGRYPEVTLSVDTIHASTAAKALELGARVINDISACRADPGLVDVLVEYQPAYVLMHCQGVPSTMQVAPRYDNVVEEIKAFFERNLAMLSNAGLGEGHIVLDPGIGFGKTMEHNLAVMRHMDDFMEFGRPVMAGLSMKSFFGDFLGLELPDRDASTAVASALLWEKGIFWHRVHNVDQVRKALLLASAFESRRHSRYSMTCGQERAATKLPASPSSVM